MLYCLNKFFKLFVGIALNRHLKASQIVDSKISYTYMTLIVFALKFVCNYQAVPRKLQRSVDTDFDYKDYDFTWYLLFFIFSDLTRLKALKQERRNRGRKFHIVTDAWVRACMEEGSMVNERAFEPVKDT